MRPTHRFVFFALLGLFLSLAPATAQTAAAGGLTVDDVARMTSVGDAVISDDGRYVAYILSRPRVPFEDEDGSAWSELHVMGPDGRGRPFITGAVRVADPVFTPDSRAITFLAKREGDDHRSVYRIPVDGGEAKKIFETDAELSAYALSPDGMWLAYTSQDAVPKERKELADKGFDQKIYEEDGRFTRVRVARLTAMDAPGRDAPGAADTDAGATEDADEDEPRLLDIEGNVSTFTWSPDGRYLAVAVAPTTLVDDSLMQRRVRVVEVSSGRVTARIDNPGKLGALVWSPDGRHLALGTAADLNDPTAGRLSVVPAAGGAVKDLMPTLEADLQDFAWKDADTLMVLMHQGLGSSVHEVSREGGAPRLILGDDPDGPVFDDLEAAPGARDVILVGSSAAHPSELYRLRMGSGNRASARVERLTDSNPWLAERRLAPQERVTYEARDGLELQGILIRPLDARPGQRVPLILVVHGGPESHYSDGWVTSYSNAGQVGAARGFAVFYPNYRGSTGRGVDFAKSSQGDPAGKEFDDLVDAVDHLVETGLVERSKVGITGGSYGGYASAWGATALTEHFAASVMFVGISEKIAKWGSSDIPQELNLVHDRHWPWEDWQLMLERSPVYHAEKARTPILILHGEEDPRVHPSQSLILYRYLKVLDNVPVRLVWYPNEGHGNRLAAHRLDYNLRMLRWFEHYLMGPGGDAPSPDLDYGQAGEEIMAAEEAVKEDEAEDDGGR